MLPDARIIRLCYEVKTAVDLTEQLALGPAMRSLQPGEILEAGHGSVWFGFVRWWSRHWGDATGRYERLLYAAGPGWSFTGC